MTMKKLRQYLSLGVIVNPLPYPIVDGQIADAAPVMANLQWIVDQVNANAQAAGSQPNAPQFTNGPPPDGVLNVVYSFAYTGTWAPTYALTAGTLPTGLTLSAAGVISGTPTVAASFTGTVTASNGVLPNAQQNFGITIAATPPPPPPPGLCTGHGVLGPIMATWGQQGFWSSSASGNFDDNTYWIFQLDVPGGTPDSIISGYFNAVEGNGPGTFRQMTISKFACDFRTVDVTGVNGPLSVSNGVSVNLYYRVAASTTQGIAGLAASQTYFINVRNWQLDPTPQPSCGLVTCNAVMNHIPAA